MQFKLTSFFLAGLAVAVPLNGTQTAEKDDNPTYGLLVCLNDDYVAPCQEVYLESGECASTPNFLEDKIASFTPFIGEGSQCSIWSKHGCSGDKETYKWPGTKKLGNKLYKKGSSYKCVKG